MIKRFLFFCSGADLSILNHPDCKPEHNKYAGIGSAVFFTACFAVISSSYALYTVFDSTLTAILLGLFWGLFIFSLDRYIVATLKKESKQRVKHTFWNSIFNRGIEIIKSLPRIALAFLLGILISKPLELKIFEKEIESELVKIQQEVFKAQEDKVKERYLPNIERYQKEISKLQAETKDKKQNYDKREIRATKEADGTGGSGIANLGPIYRVKKDNADKALAEYKSIKEKNDSLITKKRDQKAEEEGKLSKEIAQLKRNKFDGLLARLTALGKLADSDQNANLSIVAINLLFIFIELVPIFFKILADKGMYDLKLKMEEERVNSEEIEKISHLNDEINRRIKIKVAENQNILEREKADNAALMKLISDAQISIAEEIVKHWKDKQINQVKQNPDKYINNNNNQRHHN